MNDAFSSDIWSSMRRSAKPVKRMTSLVCKQALLVLLLRQMNVWSLHFMPCDEDETGADSEKNAGCGHTRENEKRAAKPKLDR